MCEYFTRYGDSGRQGACTAPATLALADNGTPPIKVCLSHARVIVSRFPELGDVEKRFIPIPKLT